MVCLTGLFNHKKKMHMNINRTFFVCSFAILLLFAEHIAAAGWKAGTAKVKITPQEKMWLSGYASRDRAAESTTVDLWAKALVVEDASGKQAVLVTSDMIGFPKGMSDRIRAQLQARFGWDKAQVILNASHTHSGPYVADPGVFNCYHDNFNHSKEQLDMAARYARWFESQIIDLIVQATRALEPVTLSAANGVARIQVNRRNNSERDLAFQTELKGPNDFAVPVLKVCDASGRMKAIVFGYACHPTVLDGFSWSGDYPGYAQLELEKSYPEATALFFQGAGADQNPLPRRSIALAKQYGVTLAAAVERTLSEEMQELPASLRVAYQEIPLTFGAFPTDDELNEIVRTNTGYQRRWATYFLDQKKSGKPLMKTYPYPVQVWNLGGLPLFSLGGELTVSYAIGLKQRYGHNAFVMGYSNDVMAYIPSRSIIEEGGYEGATSIMAEGMPAPWTDNIETLIYDGIDALAKETDILQH